ncbi:MAG: hypothetical protein K1060chlam4_00193 [Candidatus Anoxychlamydiales bacterium]|nr:hypothetical protein [Candidatus Anoxychlamydiales bacterium]
MIPKAKKNLHACKYHLNTMKAARNSEEFEIGYSAFVIFARTVTFVLQKEFSENKGFEIWYQKKRDNLSNNPIAKFFLDQRNTIEKEGINALEFSLDIHNLDLTGNETGIPQNADVEIQPNGIFHLVAKGTSKEDLLPAKINGNITIKIFLRIDGKVFNVLRACEEHYLTLKELVEEWTGKMNEEKVLEVN